MKRRIFIAINIPNNIKKSISFYQRKIKESFDSLDISQSEIVKWVKPGDAHITLSFLGNITDRELGEIVNSIKEVVQKNDSFEINLKKIEYGPKENDPKYIWIEGEKSKEIVSLQKDIEEALEKPKMISLIEKKAFSPHVTLGRIKKFEFKKIEKEDIPEVSKEISLVFDVDSIEIMESIIRREGPQYTIIQSISLKS